MKKQNLIRVSIAAVCFSVLMLACKKDSTTNSNSAPATTDLQTSTDDQAMASDENDAVSNDATASVTAYSPSARIFSDPNAGSGSRVNGDSAVCDASVVFDTTGTTKMLTVTYNGTNCLGNRTRTGTITISEPKGVYWKNAGATISITIQNLTITRIRDGKSIIINGFKTITNTSGGLLTDLATRGTITHDISDSLTIAYDKGDARVWMVSKNRVFTYANGIVITTTGTHSDGTNSDIAEWGSNRFGVSYSSRITVAKEHSQSCDFRLVSGQNTFTRGDNFTAVVTYGLDATGNPVTSCPSGNFYAQVAWTYKPTGKTGTFLFQY